MAKKPTRKMPADVKRTLSDRRTQKQTARRAQAVEVMDESLETVHVRLPDYIDAERFKAHLSPGDDAVGYYGLKGDMDALLTHGIEAIAQGAWGHSQAFGSLGFMAAKAPDGIDNVLVFGPFTTGAQGGFTAHIRTHKRRWRGDFLLRRNQTQILWLDKQTVTQHQGALQHVFQFAHIARPVVDNQGIACGLGQ